TSELRQRGFVFEDGVPEALEVRAVDDDVPGEQEAGTALCQAAEEPNVTVAWLARDVSEPLGHRRLRDAVPKREPTRESELARQHHVPPSGVSAGKLVDQLALGR